LKKRMGLLLLISMFVTLIVSGCSGGSTSAGGEETITLTVWDTFTGDAQKNASAAINKAFEAAHPNVKINQVSKTPDALDQTLKAAFMSGTAPDVIYNEAGIGAAGDYVKADHLLNLSDAFDSYGWNEDLVPVAKSIPTVGEITFAVGNELETMSLYYNQDIFDKLGLKAPESIEELTASFEVIKNAGYYPLANTLDTKWWNNMNFVGTILYSYMTKEEITAVMDTDASWDLPSVRSAVATIQLWLEKGYFPPSPEVDGDQENLFGTQKAAAWVVGNWEVAFLENTVKDTFKTAIVPFPGSETNPDGGAQVNFAGGGYWVYAKTKHQQAALDYIDFNLTDAEAVKIWTEQGKQIPSYAKESNADVSEYTKTIQNYLKDPALNNMPGINMWVGSHTFDFFSKAGQQLAIKALNADSFISTLESARNKDIAAGNTKGSFNK